jgi:hypothetical protein
MRLTGDEMDVLHAVVVLLAREALISEQGGVCVSNSELQDALALLIWGLSES